VKKRLSLEQVGAALAGVAQELAVTGLAYSEVKRLEARTRALRAAGEVSSQLEEMAEAQTLVEAADRLEALLGKRGDLERDEPFDAPEVAPPPHLAGYAERLS